MPVLGRRHTAPSSGGVVLVSEQVKKAVDEQPHDLLRNRIVEARSLLDGPIRADDDLAEVTKRVFLRCGEGQDVRRYRLPR